MILPKFLLIAGISVLGQTVVVTGPDVIQTLGAAQAQIAQGQASLATAQGAATALTNQLNVSQSNVVYWSNQDAWDKANAALATNQVSNLTVQNRSLSNQLFTATNSPTVIVSTDTNLAANYQAATNALVQLQTLDATRAAYGTNAYNQLVGQLRAAAAVSPFLATPPPSTNVVAPPP